MEDRIIALLKKFRFIEPTNEFTTRSRKMIFGLNGVPSVRSILMRELAENVKFAFALGLAAILAFLAVNGFAGRGTDKTARIELMNEARDVEFKIQLKETTYFTESADEVAALLKE